MSIVRKIAHKAEAVKGSAKRMVGRFTDSRRLQPPDQLLAFLDSP
jgi:uncharacterized protein YjbJ (UPF0337 family)